MCAPRQRGVEPTRTNRPSHSHTALTHCIGSRRKLDCTYHTRSTCRTTDLDIQRFDSVGQHYGGHSGEVPPVPIPNTEVKLACVPHSTGVGDPLGVVVRRPYSYWVIPFGLTLYILSDPCDHSHSSSPEQQLCCSGLSVFIYGSHRLLNERLRCTDLLCYSVDTLISRLWDSTTRDRQPSHSAGARRSPA